MKEDADFLSRLKIKLEETGIPYMVTGSLASSYWGVPRTTNDADLLIAPTLNQLNSFVDSLRDGYYVSSEAAREAFHSQTMFNVIDEETGWKADLIVRKSEKFDKSRFERKTLGRIFDIPIYVSSPEDVILSKLTWAKSSDSEQQIKDATGIIAIQKDKLDYDYLHRWAVEIEVEALLNRVIDEAAKT